MSQATVHVDLITPEKQVLSGDYEILVAPSPKGELGILPGHTPLLSQLVPGELRLKKDGQTQYIAISGGFVDVQKDSQVSVFAETAEFADDIDVERARLAAERAKEQIVNSDLSGEELAAVEAALTRALLRMKISDIRHRRSGGSNPKN